MTFAPFNHKIFTPRVTMNHCLLGCLFVAATSFLSSANEQDQQTDPDIGIHLYEHILSPQGNITTKLAPI